MTLDWTIGVQFGMFMFAILILNLVLFKPVLRTIEERRSRTAGAEEEAEALTKKTEIKVHSYERRMAAARQRAAEERRRVVKEGTDREKQLLDEARQKAAAIIEEAGQKVAGERDAARQALSAQVQALAVEIASKVAGRQMSAGGSA
jgi:F-type H+-transporting ATPase subunit b